MPCTASSCAKHYKVDDSTIRWESHPQEELLAILKEGKADAVTLIDQVFWHGEKDPRGPLPLHRR